ncbi:MAG: 50S ribosomal protein L19 [Rickettsiales bacterium]|nr:50S ribosomal protein L19 [Rickettsiales bacterium]
MNLLNKFNEAKAKETAANKKKYTEFDVGDTIAVAYRISEGANTRLQSFEGIVIAKSKQPSHYDASFTVRKISHEIGVERKFLFHSPLVEEINFVRKGIVKRSKLYYLRDLKGKATRIKEDLKYKSKKIVEIPAN